MLRKVINDITCYQSYSFYLVILDAMFYINDDDK